MDGEDPPFNLVDVGICLVEEQNIQWKYTTLVQFISNQVHCSSKPLSSGVALSFILVQLPHILKPASACALPRGL
ncbi:hypothetical protein PHJA_002735800 [Phtheirospermum japonicum]|uniref:Uncharacterized protein n=1 Tax=Phtheirospermum japonicum TaxID=374723 RepID=A0A830CZR9_9LAMI|nr:hypothetical protein PHJA_002735800 [Phtheirospermum japonicum]